MTTIENKKSFLSSFIYPLLVAIIIMFATGYVVFERDAHLEREKVLYEKREVLLKGFIEFRNNIDSLLVDMTKGYIKYAIDLESHLFSKSSGFSPAIPKLDLTFAEIEEVKWETKRYQEPLFEYLKENNKLLHQIDRLIRIYTLDGKIQNNWEIVRISLRFLYLEDVNVSALWWDKETLVRNIETMGEWNQFIQSNSNQGEEFTKKYPMPLRIYFYQKLIRETNTNIIRLLAKEQISKKGFFAVLFKKQEKQNIKTNLEIVDTILNELGKCREEVIALNNKYANYSKQKKKQK